MNKLFSVTAVALAAALSGAGASAATLSNLSSQSCGAFTGTWHFVNNKVTGTTPGTLSATWSSGNTCTVSASKINASTQHFYCTASGTLLGASTNLDGRLVLSDFSCGSTEPPPPPPPCDPKVEICPK